MDKPLHLLLVEDSEDDALLLKRALKKGGTELAAFHRVDTAEDLRHALETAAWDLIIADYSMPKFSGLDALRLYQEFGIDIPFIIVSGTIGENIAVATMKAGAHDYLMKDNLARLIPAIDRELAEAESRRANRRMQEQVHKLSMAIEQSPSVVMITDLDGLVEYVNPRYTALTGRQPEEVIGKFGGVFANQETVSPELIETITLEMRERGQWRGEVENRRKDGSTFWVSMAVTPITNEVGEVSNYLVMLEDITERKLAEEARRESEARFRLLVENAADAIFIVDEQGHVIDVNQQACASLGYTQRELTGMPVHHFDIKISPDQDFAQQVDPLVGVAFNTRHRRKDGSDFPVEIRITRVELAGQRLFMAMVRDITEREKFQQALRLYNEQLEELVDERTRQLRLSMEQTAIILSNSVDAIALAEANGDISVANPAFQHLLGHTVNKAIEQILTVVIGPEDIEKMTAALFTVLKEVKPARVEVRLLLQDESEIDADIALTPVMGEEGDLSGVVVSLRDITTLKDIDRLKTQFVANAAHDLANPIANLKLHLYALNNTQDPERRTRYIDVLESQTHRMENLVGDLRTLSQLDRGSARFNLQPMDLNALVDNVILAHMPSAEEKGVTLRYAPSPNPPVVMADYARFERVVVNLVANALNYTPDGGTIDVHTHCNSDSVTLIVHDNGIGIPESDMPHIFDRFFRSDVVKLRGIEGTGLGLAIVREIVEAHHGEIHVESALNEGSTFTVFLPLIGENDTQ